MKRKPLGWPDYMEPKPSKGGVRYYWNAPSWARKRGCPIKSEALGPDYGAAKARCDTFLNPLFDSWRTGGASDEKVLQRAAVGSFDWAISSYKNTNRYIKRPARTRASYDRALASVADYRLTDGRRFGSLSVKSVTPSAVERLYEKLKVGSSGKARHRSALLSMSICKLAWSAANRAHPTTVPSANPFIGLEIEYDPKKNRAATQQELQTFVAAADADGSHSLGTAAMIAYYWLPREEDIFQRFAWTDYRPADSPDHVLVWHHKNRKTERVPVPLFDADGTPLWPEMVARLDAVAKTGTLIVMRDSPDPRKKIHLPWTTGGRNPMRYVQGEVRRICRTAGLPDAITFTSFRHGGHTDGGDSGLTDAQMRALGGHKTTAALLRYAKETDAQRQIGARKRLEARTKKGNLSE
ncbi:hypothetical protein [Bradyrhizobium sp. JYMT SZCCT0428]|uniref:hypothetical protein n=1 Tax=Bradyrhizobium sp. JYMT SZCCT0428 TaxID=2807673 RepID=UPI001BAD292B|nr:hypothetical protein [Bradyrhizobium sp. JYMT SZCCT0428]MBR1149054.1 hypothetical protein [Bradyrhizobium sp. JYMT SZCCT0428]